MTDFKMVETNGIRLRTVFAGPTDGPLVLLVHGFPESWYSWRHQLGPLAEAGYRVCAMDVRGYGGSDQPSQSDAYTMQIMAADMAGLVAALSKTGKAVIIGHDWGAPIAWNSALIHPEVFTAVAGLSIPHAPTGQVTSLEVTKRAFIDKGLFFYLHYFQTPGVAEAEFEADTAAAIRNFYWIWSGDAPGKVFPAKPANSKMFDKIIPAPDLMPDWFSLEDEAYYVGEFERAGWRGALNRYRNFQTDAAFLRSLDSQTIRQPALFIAGQRDPALIMFPGNIEDRLPRGFSDLRGIHILPECGHWVQQEQPEATTKILLEWLNAL